MRNVVLLSTVALVVLSVAACGSDESSPDGASGTGGTSGGIGGASGTGAASGNGGSVSGAGGNGGNSAGAGGSIDDAGTGGSGTGGSGTGGSAGSAGATACAFSDVQRLADEPTHIVERFSYPSTGGLAIFGELCRPPGNGPYPVVVWNHGGVSGLGGSDRDICVNFARNANAVVVMSEYRGEGGSEGAVEVCLGEADDVLALTSCIAAQPYASATRMLMAGASHGGCVTLRAIQRGAGVAAAVDVFGPTDWGAEYDWMKAELAAAPQGPNAASYQGLLQALEAVTGGDPTQAAAAYDARSPLAFASDLTAYPGDLLILQGVEDPLVPPGQSCSLAGAAGSFAARHYAADAATVLTIPPAGCEASSLTWLPTPKPSPGWSGARHLVVYDGAGHGFGAAVPGETAMVDDLVGFLAAKLPP